MCIAASRRPCAIPIDYALFICFFPQLVAGPIVRARNFFRDLSIGVPPSADDVSRGVFLLTLGLTKKMAFADQFAAVANALLSGTGRPSWRAHRVERRFRVRHADLFRFLRLHRYGDRHGEAVRLSFPGEFPAAVSGARHHGLLAAMAHSLSTWLRDYLYIPLGGNRRGRWKTYRNLMLTMLLGGLWHGASWNFLIWGGYHGALLSVERATGGSEPRQRWMPLDPLRAIVTFALATHRLGLLSRHGSSSKRRDNRANVQRPAWEEPAVALARRIGRGGACHRACRRAMESR